MIRNAHPTSFVQSGEQSKMTEEELVTKAIDIMTHMCSSDTVNADPNTVAITDTLRALATSPSSVTTTMYLQAYTSLMPIAKLVQSIHRKNGFSAKTAAEMTTTLLNNQSAEYFAQRLVGVGESVLGGIEGTSCPSVSVYLVMEILACV
jgi:hypothetical protein